MNETKTELLWTLAEKVNGRWEKRSTLGFRMKSTAVRVYQNQLLDGFFSGKKLELRRMKFEVQG